MAETSGKQSDTKPKKSRRFARRCEVTGEKLAGVYPDFLDLEQGDKDLLDLRAIIEKCADLIKSGEAR